MSMPSRGGLRNRPARGAITERIVMAYCGEVGGKGRRCLVVEGRVRPARVVVFGPFRDNVARMLEAEEQRLVQQFIPHAPIEGFHEPVLHGLAGCDVVPVDGMGQWPALQSSRLCRACLRPPESSNSPAARYGPACEAARAGQ
jgi:hypothetical protein